MKSNKETRKPKAKPAAKTIAANPSQKGLAKPSE